MTKSADTAQEKGADPKVESAESTAAESVTPDDAHLASAEPGATDATASAPVTVTKAESTKPESESAKPESESAQPESVKSGSSESGSAGDRRDGASGSASGDRKAAPWWSSVRALAVAAVVALVAAVAFGVLWATDDSADQLAALQSRLDTEAAAEDAASRYAMRVSEMDFRDLEAWRTSLTEGVTEQLAPKLDAAVDVVGPWLKEMEYTSTARLLAADIADTDGDIYVVQVFVDMNSKSKQTPDGVAATATYTVTMDRASDWTITDVGGVGGLSGGLPGGGAR